MNLDDVIAESARFGPWVHFATVTPGGHPHVTPVHPAWKDDVLWTSVATDSVKVRNVRAKPDTVLHWQVGEDTGFDSLIVWGTTTVHEDLETKQALWTGVFDYDLDAFATGGPSDPKVCFVRTTPERALVLRNFGLAGRDDWRA